MKFGPKKTFPPRLNATANIAAMFFFPRLSKGLLHFEEQRTHHS